MTQKRFIAFAGVAALTVGIVLPLVVGGVLSSSLSATSAPPAPTLAAPHPVLVSGLMTQLVSGSSSQAQAQAQAPVAPVRVEVPSMGIGVDVQPVGIEVDGLLQIPEDVAIAGWYKFGSDPTSATGTTVIAAHVDSNLYGLGPFSQLKNLPTGTDILVTSADGSLRHYTVQSVDKVLKAQLPLDSIFDRNGAPRLVLITCGGNFDYDTGHYDDNVVVTAVPASP